MFQSANIAEAVQGLFGQHPTLPALVPGGLLYGILKVPGKKPYGRVLVALEGEPEYDSGKLYDQNYRLRIDIWSDAVLQNAGTIQRQLESLITANTKLPFLTGNAWTLHCSLEPASLFEEEERRNQANVFVAGGTWLLQIQENRT